MRLLSRGRVQRAFRGPRRRVRGDALPPSVSDALTLAQVQQTKRTGVLPDGALLQGRLTGHKGQALVIAPHGGEAATAAVRFLDTAGYLVESRLSALPAGPRELYTAAAAARLVLSDARPLALSHTDLFVRVNHPSLVPAFNRMLNLAPGGARALARAIIVDLRGC